MRFTITGRVELLDENGQKITWEDYDKAFEAKDRPNAKQLFRDLDDMIDQALCAVAGE